MNLSVRWLLVAVVTASSALACSPAAEPAPSAPIEVEASDPLPPPAEPPPPAPEPPPKEEAAHPEWRPPLTALTLDRLTPERTAAAQACIDDHNAAAPGAPPGSLAGAADCLQALDVPGREIAIRRIIVQQHPNTPEAQASVRALAERYEQIDRLDEARLQLEAYLNRYPRDPHALVAGQRAVCLARALHALAAAEQTLKTLTKLYGRRPGFTAPDEATLIQLCGT